MKENHERLKKNLLLYNYIKTKQTTCFKHERSIIAWERKKASEMEVENLPKGHPGQHSQVIKYSPLLLIFSLPT